MKTKLSNIFVTLMEKGKVNAVQETLMNIMSNVILLLDYNAQKRIQNTAKHLKGSVLLK